MAVVSELVTKFSFTGSTAPLGEFNDKLGSAVGLLGAVGGAFIALSGIINTFVISTLSGSDAIGQLSINTGVGIEALQELGFAASVSGSSVAAMEGSIAGLSQAIGQAAQKGSEDFARLGISVRDSFGRVKTADKVLEELRDRFRRLNLSMQEQQSFAQALGIDTSLVQMLNKTSAEMELLRKKARDFGLVTEKQQKAIIDFNDSFTTLRFGMDAVKKQIAIGLSPTIKDMTKIITDFLLDNKDQIIAWAIAFGNGVGVVVDAIIRLRWVLAALAVVLAVIAVIMAPISVTVLAFAAAIAFALVVIDDLIVAMNGGNSVIRDLAKSFLGFDITPGLQKIRDFFIGLKDLIVENKQSIIDFGKTLASLNPVNLAENAVGKVSDFLGFGGNTQSTNNNVNQEIKIEITSNDPEAVGQAVNESLQSQLANANTQTNRGGR